MVRHAFYRNKWIALLVLCCFWAVSLHASLNPNCNGKIIDLEQKFYVTAEQIQFSENKIYIILKDITYVTPAILSDEDGYYIEQIAKSGNCAWYEWKCTRCGFCNMRGLDYECRSCGYPISY